MWWILPENIFSTLKLDEKCIKYSNSIEKCIKKINNKGKFFPQRKDISINVLRLRLKAKKYQKEKKIE